MFCPAVNQVAGHEAGVGKIGPLVDGAGKFYKPMQDGERGEREKKFYEQFWADENVPASVKAFFPCFYGTAKIEAPNGSGLSEHAVLEDLTYPYHQPCVIDIKMGAQTWYPGASDNYIAKCMVKDEETTSKALGFRVCGLQVYYGTMERKWKPARSWCKILTTDAVKSLLNQFVSCNPTENLHPDSAFASAVYGGSEGIINQLIELKCWFKTQNYYQFYSSSVLLIYEGNSTSCGCVGNLNPSVKLVDFAHVLSDQGSFDKNFYQGLDSLISILSEIVKDSVNSNPTT